MLIMVAARELQTGPTLVGRLHGRLLDKYRKKMKIAYSFGRSQGWLPRALGWESRMWYGKRVGAPSSGLNKGMAEQRPDNGVDRQAHHVAARAGYGMHQEAADTLDAIGAGLVHGLV